MMSGAAWIHVGTFSVHELHGKGHKMPRACERRHSNKGAGGQVALANSGLHAPREMWVFVAMKWEELGIGRKLCHVAMEDGIFVT